MPADVPDYQPPVTRWGAFWRFVGCLLVGALAWAELWEHQLAEHREWIWLGLGIGVAAYVVARQRREHPLAVVVVTGVLSVFSAPAAGPAILAIVSLATRRRYREIAFAGVVSVVTGVLFYEVQPKEHGEPLWFDVVFNLVVTVAVLGWGMFIGSRRELIWTLRRRAETAEAEQALRVTQARNTERRRIAREMHDVLAHRISQIALQAGALGYRDDLSPEQVRDGVGLIREKAHEALTDLRAVLGVLRDSSGELTPQPTYADLDPLLAEARAGGLSVDLVDDLDAGLPDATGRTVYRIVQEGITNAGKHAPGARLSVTLTGSPDDGVSVTLRNPLGFQSGTPGAGLGLIGLTERAELAGGTLTHRVQQGAFVLEAWIPWAA